jgi:hypothetical protein
LDHASRSGRLLVLCIVPYLFLIINLTLQTIRLQCKIVLYTIKYKVCWRYLRLIQLIYLYLLSSTLLKHELSIIGRRRGQCTRCGTALEGRLDGATTSPLEAWSVDRHGRVLLRRGARTANGTEPRRLAMRTSVVTATSKHDHQRQLYFLLQLAQRFLMHSLGLISTP